MDIRISGVPGGHLGHDCRGRGKRRSQEGTREEYRGNQDWRMDWTRRIMNDELFSGCVQMASRESQGSLYYNGGS